MKGLCRVIAVITMVGMLYACNSNDRQPQNYNNNSDKLANDTDGDTTPDTAAKLHMVMDTTDLHFAVEAMNGGLTEVALGQLAIKNGTNKQIKNFGAMMVKDHGKANDKLLAIIKEKDIKLPTLPDAKSQALINQLSAKKGADFDKAYVDAMVDDHKEDVHDFTTATTKLQDPELKAFAKKTLPVIQNHLDKINAIHDNVK